jgi:hypothetical protein
MEHILTYDVTVGGFTWTGQASAGQENPKPKLAFNQLQGIFLFLEMFCYKGDKAFDSLLMGAINDYVQRSRLRKSREEKRSNKLVNKSLIKIEKIFNEQK